MPAAPEELASLDWVALTLLPAPFTWRFSSLTGETRTVQVKARVRVDSPGVLRALLQQHMGISVLDQFNAQTGISQGRLVRLLPEWSLPSGGIHAVRLDGKSLQRSAASSAFTGNA